MADVTLGSPNNGAGFPKSYNWSAALRMDTNSTLVYTAGHVVKEVGVWQGSEPSGPNQVHISIYDISGGANGAPLIYTTTIDSDVGTGVGLYLTKAIDSAELSGLTGGEVLALEMGFTSGETFYGARVTSSSTSLSPGPPSQRPLNLWVEDSTISTATPDAYFILGDPVAGTPTLRKGSQFDVETTLAGTVTSATLNGAAITVDSHVGTTVTLTDSDGSITTSGEYDLVLTDDAAATETITVQVNVYGVVPSNNPLQKDGAALASLTDVEVRVSAGATLAGSQLFYSGTATTDASGNLGNIDLSSTNANDADPVLLSIRTAAGDSIVATETVGII